MTASAHRRFHIRDLARLRAELAELGLDLPIEEDLSPLAQPVRVGARTAPNRFAVQPMEGFDSTPDGGPGELTFRRYRRYAAGGSGLIWFEATAVLPEARSNPGQLCLHEGNAAGFRRLTDETRRAAREALGREPVLLVQLTHSGRYSKPTGIPQPLIAHHSAILDPRHGLPPDHPLVTDEYLDRLQEVFVRAARLAAQAGFDGVDIKSCHRYLLSELLASFTREGRYGGSFENRTRMLRETVARVRAEVPELFVCTRMNAYDAIEYPYGFGVRRENAGEPDLAEPTELARRLAELGIAVLNVSIGNPYYNPQYGRPFDFPIQGGEVPGEHPLRAVVRLAEITRQMQAAVPSVPVVATGYAWLRHLLPPVAAGLLRSGWAGLVGQGRGAFAYPDSVNEILRTGRMDPEKCCVTCSACTQIMRDGGTTGCVVRDREIYAPAYRRARRFAADRLKAEAQRCRECEFAMCAKGCPAHVNVPGFVRAFAEGDIRRSYDILREGNRLPEMCACVCQSEVQCEGGCLEDAFCQNPIPIRDIQRVVCQMARRAGYTGVRLPATATGRTAAVVGGGPAGLACAIVLLEKGHAVTLVDRDPRLGGTPDSLIPASRYEGAEAEVAAILAPALQAGRLTIQAGKELGKDMTLDELRRTHEAVFLGIGLGADSGTAKAVEGVTGALAFLREAKCGSCRTLPASVAVIGGGNTAVDAAVTARALGARDVYVVYRRSLAEMPAWPDERERLAASGTHLLILLQPVGYEVDAGGRLTGLKVARTRLGEPDASGRRRPVPVPGSESVLAVGLVIEATGQTVPDDVRRALAPVTFTRAGLVETGSGRSTTGVPGVFAGGDLVNGGTTAVQGVADGMRAAAEMDEYLQGISSTTKKPRNDRK